MLAAAWWGFVGGVALVLGGLAGALLRVPRRLVGLVMAFGAGVLFSACAFELTAEAYDTSSGIIVLCGLVAGSVTYFAGDRVLARRGAARRKSMAGSDHLAQNASAIVLGSVLDGIPESVAIGASLLGGGAVGGAVVVAVFLSNVPESLSASAGMRASGKTVRYITAVWLAVTAVATLSSLLGYVLLQGVSDDVVAGIQTFAAGAILTMLADTMLPESVENAGDVVGLATAVGFALSFLLSTA